MSLTPGYGETPVDGDELAALAPAAKDLLGGEVTKPRSMTLNRPCRKTPLKPF